MQTDDYTPVLHRPPRSPMIPCVVVFVLIVALAIGAYVSSHSRYKVVGKAYKTPGYRIEYTVSSRYRNLYIDDQKTLKAAHELENRTFMPTSRAAPLEWYYTYILRRNDAATMPDANADMFGDLKAHEIRQTTFIGDMPEGHGVDSQGYVKPGDIAGVGEYVSQEQSLISNCPSTWYSFDRTNVQAGGSPMRYYNLFIRPKGKQITFIISGISHSGQEPNDVLDEITEIRNSIRIVKVH